MRGLIIRLTQISIQDLKYFFLLEMMNKKVKYGNECSGVKVDPNFPKIELSGFGLLWM